MNQMIHGKEVELTDYIKRLSRYEEDMNEYRNATILLKDQEAKIILMQ